MAYETLKLEVVDQVARLTLHRPEAANAIDMTMGKELMDAAIRCDMDPDVRAVLLTGSGKMFCGGGDLKSFVAMGDAMAAGLKALTGYLHSGVSRLARMEAPIVVAVNGAAAGAGMSLAAAGDLVLAAESSKFTMAYTAVGMSPDGSSTYFLPRVIGMRRTQELLLTNRRLTAAEARDWGLVTRVVPDDELLKEALQLALQLARGPTRAFGAVRRLLHESLGGSLEGQMERESREFVRIAESHDGPEGMRAFVEKRRPEFEGT